MKKYLSVVILSLAAVLLSGCSLNSAGTTSTPSSAPAASSIYKSTDGGKTWEAKNKTGEKINLASVDVLSIAANPYDRDNILVGTAKDGILETTDGGENWSLFNFQSEKVYGLAFDNMDGRIIYASGVWQNRGKIFKSTDSGQNWQEIYTTPANGPLVISLALDRKNSNIIYVTTSDNQVIKSTDAGGTWKSIFQASSPVLKVAVDSANDNLLYLNLQGGSVFRSKNGGNTLEEISKAIFAVEKSSQSINLVETDPNNGNWVYVAGQIGILRSKDSGNTWEKINILSDSQNFPVKTLAINPFNSQELVYGASQATYKSTDGGINWATSQFQTSKTINVLKYSPASPGVIFLGLDKSN